MAFYYNSLEDEEFVQVLRKVKLSLVGLKISVIQVENRSNVPLLK